MSCCCENTLRPAGQHALPNASTAGLMSLDGALERIAEQIPAIQGSEAVVLCEAVGRVLATDVKASAAVPAFDSSAMDGYAVATASLVGRGPWLLPVVARVAAGQSASKSSAGSRASTGSQALTGSHASTGPQALAGPSAVRIFTGAPVPAGADAVIQQEAVRREGDRLVLHQRPEPGLNLRPAGGDMRAGQVVLRAGDRLTVPGLAAAAAAGAGQCELRRRLKVALLVTGDELQPAGRARSAAQIWDINTPMFSAALSDPAIELVRLVKAPDQFEATRGLLAELCQQCDLVVTTGGISVGEEDHVKPAMAALGADFIFSGLAIKPGKPVTCGRLGQTMWLGLPGNPVSALVTWCLLGRALLGRLLGLRPRLPERQQVVSASPVASKPGRCDIRPARLLGYDEQGRQIAAFAAAMDSSKVAGLPEADGLVILPESASRIERGDLLDFVPF